MRILFRMTLLGIFSAAGLALAILVVQHMPPIAEVSHAAPLAAMGVVERVEVPTPPVSPAAAEPPSLALAAPARDARDELEAGLSRFTASYLPAITRQFELLEKAQETAQRLQEQAQRTADDLDRRAQAEPAPPAGDPLPSPTPPAAAAPGSEDVVTPEVQRDSDRGLVSVNAPKSDIREVLKFVSDAIGLNILATPSVKGIVSVSLIDVPLDEALIAILKSSGFSSRREGNFVYVGTVEEIANLATANDRVSTRVYQPNYISADELQKLFTPMQTKGIGSIAISAAPEVGIGSNKDAAGGNSYAGREVVLVRDFESVLQQMDEVFLEVDRMPSQVAIEATILSVRLDDSDSLGVNFELLRNKQHLRLTSGPLGTTTSTATTLPTGQIPATGLAALNFNDGLKIALLDESVFAFIEALETVGDTNVIASPHVMCLNKQRAEILIGSELGYVSTTVTETAATQSVEFLEVGTHLKIRPFISADGMVRLEVHPELSTGNVRVQGGFTLPDKDVTQVTTNIMCRSGGTVVIGGLIREDLVTTSTQIPVLGNLPLVGGLFRQRTEDTERREIIVLLTPRIVGEPGVYEEGDLAATQIRDRRNVFFDKMQPTNKRRIAERYHRLAISAWAAEDSCAALRYANLAIHYDPLLQGAIDLRQEVLAVDPSLEHGVHDHLREGLRPLEVPHYDYSAATGWPWREVEPVRHEPGAYLPSDTGTSGRVRTLVTDHPDPAGPRSR